VFVVGVVGVAGAGVLLLLPLVLLFTCGVLG